MTEEQQESIELKGVLKGHTDWVTCIATTPEDSDILLTGSRDKTIIKWDLRRGQDPEPYGVAEKRLTGHHHIVQDLDISSDGKFALSASWDRTLRLWNLQTGQTSKQFRSHTKDVLSVAFSSDNRQIVSGSRDRTIKLWNTIGDCKYTMEEGGTKLRQSVALGHTDWVTCVRFSPNAEEPIVVSAGRDHVVKVWDLNELKLKFNLEGHTSYVNTVTVSPDGSLCASGGKDGNAMLWDLNEGKELSKLSANGEIHALCFSPNRYWLCGAVGPEIKIWDLESKVEVGVLKPNDFDDPKCRTMCISLAWSPDGKTLYAGYTDNKVRVWVLI